MVLKVPYPYDEKDVRIVICICGREVKIPDPFYGIGYARNICVCGIIWNISSKYSVYMSQKLTPKEVATKIRSRFHQE